MTRINKLLTCLIVLLVFSCAEKTETKTVKPIQDTIQKDSVAFAGEDHRAKEQKILEVFTEFPVEIDGCSCYFSLTDDDFKGNKYVLVSNFGKDAFVKVNGKMEKLELIKDMKFSTSKTHKSYTGKYFLIIETEKTGQVDETWQQKGKLIISQGQKEIYSTDIIGECGC